MTEQRTYPDAHRFTASRPDGVVCIAQRAALTPGVCGYPAGHPIHAAPAKHPASSSAARVDTPAERITGISDRRAAALVDLAELQQYAAQLAPGVERGQIMIRLDRIETALREGGAR